MQIINATFSQFHFPPPKRNAQKLNLSAQHLAFSRTSSQNSFGCIFNPFYNFLLLAFQFFFLLLYGRVILALWNWDASMGLIPKWRVYRWLRARRALTLTDDVSLRTRRVQSPLTLYSDSALLVLNRTSLNFINALLVLNRTSLNCINALLALNWRYLGDHRIAWCSIAGIGAPLKRSGFVMIGLAWAWLD